MIDQKLFINRLFNESVTLLVEARNYLEFSEVALSPARVPNPRDKLFISAQALRFTSRMTQTMAWLLAQRAVYAGELSFEEACNGEFSLGGEVFCVENDGQNDIRLPQGLQNLLARSHSLYHRVLRLDRDSRRRIENGLLDAPPAQTWH